MAGGMYVQMRVEGLEELDRHFDALEHNLHSTETMAEIGKTIEEATMDRWGKGIKDEDDTFERWGYHDPLELAGSLKASMHIHSLTPTTVGYGTNLYYARFLQNGTEKMKRKRIIRLPRKALKALVAKAVLRGTGAEGLAEMADAEI